MSTTVSTVPTGTWQVDGIHSSVAFRVKHLGVSTFKGAFEQLEATYDGDAQRLTGSVPVESIDIRQPEQFRQHVLSAEFFDAASYPTIEFASSAIEAGAGESVDVTGELTINGITKPISATGRVSEVGEDMQGQPRFALEISTTIDRREFGLSWQVPLPGGRNVLDWDVTLDVTLELFQPQEA